MASTIRRKTIAVNRPGVYEVGYREIDPDIIDVEVREVSPNKRNPECVEVKDVLEILRQARARHAHLFRT